MLTTPRLLDRHDIQHCRELIRHGSHSFFMASKVLPRAVADPTMVLYAFCRIADDLIDADQAGHAALTRLGERLNAIYASKPEDDPIDRCLATVVADYKIPRSMLDALLEGLAWDTLGRQYETLSELYDYAARVAGCVGAMMSLIMRTTDERAIARACDLGVAMQLTNIARDVGEDAAMGRLYLPRAWFRDAGIDPDAWCKNPVDSPAIRGMIQRLIRYAEVLYQRGEAGIGLLPANCRPGIRAAGLIYGEIGFEVQRRGYDSLHGRAIVPKKTRLKLLLCATLGICRSHRDQHADSLAWPPLSETRYLLADIESVPTQTRIAWLIDLFHDMDRRDRQLS